MKYYASIKMIIKIMLEHQQDVLYNLNQNQTNTKWNKYTSEPKIVHAYRRRLTKKVIKLRVDHLSLIKICYYLDFV